MNFHYRSAECTANRIYGSGVIFIASKLHWRKLEHFLLPRLFRGEQTEAGFC